MFRPYAEVFLERPRPESKMPAPREVRVVQAEYAHEIAVVTYVYTDKLLAAVSKGKPISVRWGWPPQIADFVGYVHHVAVDHEADRPGFPRLMRVVCVGATDVFNQTAFRQYRGVRVDAAVTDVVTAAGLSALIERHGYAWPLLQQEGQSTWAFLADCARRIGWTLYARGTDVRCHSRVIRNSGALTYRQAISEDDYNVDRMALYTFKAVQAETLKDAPSNRARVVRGVDSTGVLFTVTTGSPEALAGARALAPRLVEYTNTAAASVAEAQAILAGEQENNRHHIRAKATVTGDPRLHPARTVRLLGQGRDNDGLWYTTRVEHVLTGASYRAALELGRDSVGDSAAARLVRVPPGDTSVRPVVQRGAALEASALDASAPAPRYADGRWLSTAPVERVLPAVRRPAATVASSRPTGVFGGARA